MGFLKRVGNLKFVQINNNMSKFSLCYDKKHIKLSKWGKIVIYGDGVG